MHLRQRSIPLANAAWHYPTLSEVRCHSIRPLREHLKRVLRTQRHHREHPVDQLIRHELAEEIRLRAHEDAPPLLPAQWLEQDLLVKVDVH